jgi:hypothetical protein
VCSRVARQLGVCLMHGYRSVLAGHPGDILYSMHDDSAAGNHRSSCFLFLRVAGCFLFSASAPARIFLQKRARHGRRTDRTPCALLVLLVYAVVGARWVCCWLFSELFNLFGSSVGHASYLHSRVLVSSCMHPKFGLGLV